NTCPGSKPGTTPRSPPSSETMSVGSFPFLRRYSTPLTAPRRALEKSSSATACAAHRIDAVDSRDAPITARSAASVDVASKSSNILHPFRLRGHGGWGAGVVLPSLLVEPRGGVGDVLDSGPLPLIGGDERCR